MSIDSTSLQDFILGKDSRSRLRLTRTAIATAVYVVCLSAQWISARVGIAAERDALGITVFCVTGLCVFLVAIRSGLSNRLRDAALTMPQMVFALVSLAFAYHINPIVRGSVALVVPLVLVFGAFILPARRCVQLGWFAVALFAATVGIGVWSRPEVFDPLVEAHTFGAIALVVPTIAYLAGQLSQMRIDQKAQKIELRDAIERLRRMATHDPLTGLPNRRHVDECIGDMIGRARGAAAPFCIAILDLDRFKRINDTFGHAAGDEVLRVFAREAGALLRAGDLLARWGGEEFLLVLPATSLFDAQAIIERMRKRVAASGNWAAYPHSRVTFSAGVAVLREDRTLAQALQCADFALYDAKSEGRDRIVVADDDCLRIAEQAAALPRRFRVDHPSNIF